MLWLPTVPSTIFGRGQSPRTAPPLSTLLSLMNEYKYFEEMLLTDVDAVSIYCLISHGEGDSPRPELSLSTTTPISSMSAYESDKSKSLKIEDVCLNIVPLVMGEGSHQEQKRPFIQCI